MKKEAALIKQFIMDVDLYGLGEYVRLDEIDGDGISGNDSLFLECAFTAAKIEIDTTVEAMYCCSDVITGICCKCGETFQGIEDELEVTYEEYLEYEEAAANQKIYCADCV